MPSEYARYSKLIEDMQAAQDGSYVVCIEEPNDESPLTEHASVSSRYHLVPVQQGLGIEVTSNAKVGATNLLSLYLWGQNRQVVHVLLRLTVAA